MGSELVEFPFSEIGRVLLAEEGSTGLPSPMHGVFFMDGNPLPDDCFTFHRLRFDHQRWTLALPVHGHLQWTFHPTWKGRALALLVSLTRMQYIFQFSDETLTHAVITPVFFGVRVPTWLIEFTLDRTPGNTDSSSWERRNRALFGRFSFGGYTARRVIEGDGRATEAFEPMLASVHPTFLTHRDRAKE